jgi:hypothetical protein
MEMFIKAFGKADLSTAEENTDGKAELYLKAIFGWTKGKERE